ncbi:leucine-rich repeat-containing protein 24-like [Hylaeus volcanicus]|uniref:leucine-rich repeat-containing protein 24-like n=1 Tax=Hylaeus volcanicus TaxID=313075 RepID=UPI0023B7A219|nr:leucine-rich repeat-containing protein 24-like [Hylaeus volcanicus]XP_053977309.1 leucine-rich repeat-containing protein 24-like [Hylaeus volcanicus]XP_053977310.1 leucine-rich repeat-containing protein 24-like [Hylaeus volcanicus]XP_053977311.1 leucine-rich repeat-containing protein 24-like [Hylaeus volcanicus]XP_053977312.1 leucine-rich repeat-containing protein 24-like [Hylaeus volcanicus]
MELITAKLLLYSTLVVVVCWSQEDWTAQCSPSCKCRWVSGKRSAECVNQNLTQVPGGLSSQIQNLDLKGNRITHLMHKAFDRVHLVNLHKLVLQKCEIESIHTDAFLGLKLMIELDLSANNIRTLYPGTFDDTTRLRVLLLNENKLKVLENGLFHDLVFLQKVSLSKNELERIEEKAFRNLSKLQQVTLDGNNLSTLKMLTFDKLPNLGSLELHNNPWNCNCRLKRFRDWTMTRKLYTKPTTCQQPIHLADKMWDEINSDEFACRPEIFTIGPSVKIEVGRGNVTLWCRASGIPRPQLFWIYRSRVLENQTRRHNGEKGYILKSSHDWLNLTIPDVAPSDKGDYVCLAKSPGGNTEKNVSLAIAGDAIDGRDNIISLPLALGLGVTALVLLIVTLSLCVCYCKRRRVRHDEKSLEAASMEHHGLGEQEKSLITTINPVVKPPRRYEAPSVTSHGTEMTELNRTLLDNDSVFADGIGGGVGGGVIGGVGDDEREERATPELESGTGTLCRGGGGSYRQYPPDLLAFSGGRGASPTSQASTAPDNTRLPSQHATPTTAAYGSPSNQFPAAFKTLPHNRSITPYSVSSSTIAPVMPRHGYVTIPRRPRAPSWSSGPPTSPTDGLEPVYDNLGLRTTADGSSVLSLNKSPEPLSSIRSRPLPGTPSSHYGTIQRSTPNILTSSPLDRAAPEGAAEWPTKLADESTDSNHVLGQQQQSGSNTLGRKVPPRPPPKPKKKSTNGPLYEDEGEDGTEV